MKNGELAGVIVCMRWKDADQDFMAPLAYGGKDDPSPEHLLRDRGATIFPNYSEAEKALERSVMEQNAQGFEWVRRARFAFVECFAAGRRS